MFASLKWMFPLKRPAWNRDRPARKRERHAGNHDANAGNRETKLIDIENVLPEIKTNLLKIEFDCLKLRLILSKSKRFVSITGCSGKIVFFTIHCNPSLAYIAVRDLQCSQRKASVQSLLLAGSFLYNQWQPSAGEGEVANFREFLEKNTIFNEHPVHTGNEQKSFSGIK